MNAKNLEKMQKQENQGFSLLEMLIAAFLLVILVGGCLMVLKSANRVWVRGKTDVGLQTEARNLISFLNRLISGAVFFDTWEKTRPEFIGAPERLSFCGLIPDNEKQTDFARLELFLDPNDHTLYVSEERAGDVRKDFSAPDGKGRQPVSFSVRKMDFGYFNGVKFQPNWDSRKGAPEAGRLPKAVRIKFRLSEQMREGKEPAQDFETLIELKTN